MKLSIALLFGILLSCTYPSWTQAPNNDQPQKVHSIVVVQYDYDWYNQQHALWKKALEKQPNNPDGWLSFYTASRMAKILAPDTPKREEWMQEMDRIVEAMKPAIPNTYEYHFIQGYHELDHLKQMPHIFKAYEMNPERPDVYDDLVTYYELTRDKKKLKEIATKWKASGDYSPTVMHWNYNMLVSTAPNSILVTYGDNDTYPAWLLQQADNIRPDVQVININLLQRKDYRDLLFKELNIPLLENPEDSKAVINHLIQHKGSRPLYTSMSVPYKKWGLECKLYNVGLALLYGESEEQTLSYLVNNYENNLLLDHLKCSIYPEAYPHAHDWFKKLYVPGFLLLHQHYALTNNRRKQEEVKSLLLKITQDWPEKTEIITKLQNQEGK